MTVRLHIVALCGKLDNVAPRGARDEHSLSSHAGKGSKVKLLRQMAWQPELTSSQMSAHTACQSCDSQLMRIDRYIQVTAPAQDAPQLKEACCTSLKQSALILLQSGGLPQCIPQVTC